MNPDTDHTAASPPDGFEERLLSRILADFDELATPPVRRRRRSRPRPRGTSRPALAAIAPVVAMAAVLAVVAIVALSERPRDGGAAPAIPAHDTAYIVDRVRANVARLAVAGEGRVLERSATVGDGTAGDPLIRNVDWAYIAPRTHVAYQRSVDQSADGTVLSINKLVTTPVADVEHTQVTFVDPSRHAYDVARNAPPSGTVTAARSQTALGIRSSAHQIDLALRSNRVTERGTTTIDGQRTIELSVPPPVILVKAGMLPAHTRITLYVSARHYQPVEEIDSLPRGRYSPRATSISRWLPTTRRTIALAKVGIPGGYRRVDGPVTSFWNNAKPLFFIGY